VSHDGGLSRSIDSGTSSVVCVDMQTSVELEPHKGLARTMHHVVLEKANVRSRRMEWAEERSCQGWDQGD
jgi:hypothetical protein